MGKLFFSMLLISGLLFVLISPANSCVDLSYTYNFELYGVSFDIAKLQSLCSPDTCALKEANKTILIQSLYDERVGIEIGEGSLAIRLPLGPWSEEGSLVINYPFFGDSRSKIVEPRSFNWTGCLKQELEYLKKVEVVALADEEIDKISKLAGSGQHVLYTKDNPHLSSLQKPDPESEALRKMGRVYRGCRGPTAPPLALPPKQLFVK